MHRSRPDVVLVGAGPLARETARDIRTRTRVLGTFSLGSEAVVPDLGIPCLGRVEDLADYLVMNPVDEVYLAADLQPHYEALQAVVSLCERLGVPFAVPAHIFSLDRALPRLDTGIEDGFLHYGIVISSPFQETLKRTTDVVLSACALIALSPVFLVAALAIKLTSPGPVLFRQTRVGLLGRHFEMLKFRSMVVDAERRLETLQALNEQTGPTFKMRHDPRVTRVGRFLRTYSVDELPQLVNVLKGDMSIVGPRPPVPREVAQYQLWQRRRLSVRPGLTCLWQVAGRNDIGFDEWMMLDLQYVDQWSLSSDVALIGRTVPVVVSGRGAS